jgi:alpha-glutamyl/putrescinyl thymine pyrophosphorylase clade 1
VTALHPAPEPMFWYWIRERHAIYERRAAGQPPPWTEDEILRTYRFTNVFRQLDRGTIWLTEHFLTPHRDAEPGLLIFNVTLYRQFNWTGTGERLGWIERWDKRRAKRILAKADRAGKKVFTGAHIVWGETGRPKIDSVLDSCSEVWRVRTRIAKMAAFSRSLEAVFRDLIQVRGIGPFIAYEIVTDLRHTRVLEQATDINKWANVGPGALRGLRRLYPEMAPKHALNRMRDLLARSPLNLPATMPELELRDIEMSLCEFDKFCRVKFGEGRPRSTYPGKGIDVHIRPLPGVSSGIVPDVHEQPVDIQVPAVSREIQPRT